MKCIGDFKEIYITNRETVQISIVLEFQPDTYDVILEKWIAENTNPHGLPIGVVKSIFRVIRDCHYHRHSESDRVLISEDEFKVLKSIQIYFDSSFCEMYFGIIANEGAEHYARFSIRD